MREKLRKGIISLLFIMVFGAAAEGDVLTGYDFEHWGTETINQIKDDFSSSAGLYATEPGWTNFDTVWPQGVMLGANIAAAHLDPSLISTATRQADSIRTYYYCYRNGIWGYDAVNLNCNDRYYDDNAWLALDFIALYELTGTVKYLDWAKDTLVFCMSGENGPGDSPEGGIRWKETNTSGVSICASSPTILANLRMYQTTGIESYFVDGLRVYEWLRDESGLKTDNWLYHEPSQGVLGYLTGVMTQAAIALYEITGDEGYKQEAYWMAQGMEDVFINPANSALNQHGKWGGHDMTDAFVELYKLDGNRHWLNVAAGYLEYIYIYCLEPVSGLYPEVWNDTSGDYSRGMIDAASVAKSYLRMGSVGDTKIITQFSHFQKHMVGRWKLDETSGTVAADSSGYGNNGTLSGSGLSFDTSSVTAPLGGGLYFDGTDDHIDVPDGFGNFKGGMTVALWANPSSNVNWARFIDFGNGEYNNNIVMARRGTTNNLVFEGYDRTNSGGQVQAVGAIELNKWQHFTATLDIDGHVVLYKNGEAIASGTTAVPSNIERVNNYIGRSNWSGDKYYRGSMDDIRIYNYALSADDVAAIYQDGGQAENPEPVDGNELVSEICELSWMAGSRAVSHNVYIGTDAEAVANATIGSAEYMGNQSGMSYVPELEAESTYYWRVDEVNESGTVLKGRLWSFTTTRSVEAGLLTHLTMDSGYVSGKTVVDSSQCPYYSGTMYGPVVSSEAISGEAFRFDGANDYIDLADGLADFSGGMTVSLWAKPEGTPNWARFLDMGNGAANNNILFARNGTSTNLSFSIYDGSSNGTVTANGAIVANQWQMFTATVTPSGYVRLYKNGGLVARGFTKKPPVISRAKNYIGKSNWSDAYYKGLMDDYGIWNRMLSADEVRNLYNRGQAKLSLAESGDPMEPVLHWQFNEGGGSVVTDVSGHGNDGAMVDMDESGRVYGKQCGGLEFDGVDDYVEAYGFTGITGEASRTCCLWVKTDVPSYCMLSWGARSAGNQWLLVLNGDGTLRVGANGGYVSGSTNLADDEWHHVAVVLENDGSVDISETDVYIDGKLENLSTVAALAVNTLVESNMKSGVNQPYSVFTKGKLDEVKIYSRALSYSEIVSIYNSELLSADLVEDGMVDMADFAVLAGEWLRADGSGDMNCDGIAGVEDLQIFADEWLDGK